MASQSTRLLSQLKAAGINAESVVRNRRTGILSVRFGKVGFNFYEKGTDPGKVWGEKIVAALPHLEVVDTYDSVADWRPNKPVLFATVFLRQKERPND